MKFQHAFYTAALSIAVATASGTALAQSQEESLDPVDRHGGLEVEVTEVDTTNADNHMQRDMKQKHMDDMHAQDAMKHDKTREKDTSMNNNRTDVMRERAADMDEHPNSGNRAVPGAPHAGKNPDIDPVAGEHDFVE